MDPKFSALEMIGDLDAGVFEQKLSRVLCEVAAATCEYNRAGQVVVVFTMKRLGESSQVLLSHQIKKVRPTKRGTASEDDTTSTSMFVGVNGQLTLMPFNQGQLFEEEAEEPNS